MLFCVVMIVFCVQQAILLLLGIVSNTYWPRILLTYVGLCCSTIVNQQLGVIQSWDRFSYTYNTGYRDKIKRRLLVVFDI